jgi:hypothetical protein
MTEITSLLDVRQTRLHNHLDTNDTAWDRDITGLQCDSNNNQEYILEVVETSRLWVDMYDVIGFKP